MRLVCSLALALLCLAMSASAQTQVRVPVYKVDMQLTRDGSVFATPQIRMREGGTTIVTVDRPDGYSMRVTLGRWQGDGSGERFRVASELYFQSGGRWVLTGTPELIAPLGRRAKMDVANAGGGRLIRSPSPSPACPRLRPRRSAAAAADARKHGRQSGARRWRVR
jgi:hypothetical protein